MYPSAIELNKSLFADTMNKDKKSVSMVRFCCALCVVRCAVWVWVCVRVRMCVWGGV
jgi:hypothetical protein